MGNFPFNLSNTFNLIGPVIKPIWQAGRFDRKIYMLTEEWFPHDSLPEFAVALRK